MRTMVSHSPMKARTAAAASLAIGSGAFLLMRILSIDIPGKSSLPLPLLPTHHRLLQGWGRTPHLTLPIDPKTVELRNEHNLVDRVDILPTRNVDPMPHGSWLLDKNKTFASPVCCDRSWSKREDPPLMCGETSAPMGGFLPEGKGGAGCICHDFHDEYTWSGTSLLAWDATDACRRLDGRKVLMIGDSTMNQAAAALINAVFPGGCHNQFLYMIADTLIHKMMGARNRGSHWITYVHEHDPDIVIITAGAHIYGRENFDLVLNSLIDETQKLKRVKPNIQVVWKTQQPGGCTPDIIDNVDDLLRETQKYNYDEFYERDQHVLSVLPSHGIHIIDMRMLYFRSDAHIDSRVDPNEQKDCLHMCVPGPLDVIAVLFSKLLDQLESLVQGEGGVVV